MNLIVDKRRKICFNKGNKKRKEFREQMKNLKNTYIILLFVLLVSSILPAQTVWAREEKSEKEVWIFEYESASGLIQRLTIYPENPEKDILEWFASGEFLTKAEHPALLRVETTEEFDFVDELKYETVGVIFGITPEKVIASKYYVNKQGNRSWSVYILKRVTPDDEKTEKKVLV